MRVSVFHAVDGVGGGGCAPLPEQYYDLKECVAGFQDTIERALRFLVAREHLVEQTKYALLTREHQLIFGLPGTAKSLLTEAVVAAFSDDRPVYFNQLTSETTEGQLLDPVGEALLEKWAAVVGSRGIQ